MVELAAAVSHDICLFTNDRLTAECGLSNSDLAFCHEWPSIFNSGQDPKTQHIFSHQDTVHLTVTWVKAIVPSHHTDQQANMQLLTQQGRGEKARGQGKKKKTSSVAAVGVLLWFKWVHSLLDKQSDRSASVTGRACGSLERQAQREAINYKVKTTVPRGENLTKGHKSFYTALKKHGVHKCLF